MPFACHRLVDGVVDDLPEAVHEGPARPFDPIYMPGRLRTSFEPFKHLEMVGRILGIHNL